MHGSLIEEDIVRLNESSHCFFQDILCTGILEKRRDGAVRGGWATRTFCLNRTSLVYFRRVTEEDLFGEERGQVCTCVLI